MNAVFRSGDLPGKLNLPDLPAQYSNLQACCVYAGVDEQKTPREHLGEPIYQLIVSRAEQSSRALAKLSWYWSSAGFAIVACAFGVVSDQPANPLDLGVDELNIFGTNAGDFLFETLFPGVELDNPNAHQNFVHEPDAVAGRLRAC